MHRIAGSFRDPAGFVYYHDGVLLRQVNDQHRYHYDQLMGSGLYNELVEQELLIPHEEENPRFAHTSPCYKVIRPETVEFISYPYEWCFGQLKDAALTTLAIQKIAISHGMTLKDCSFFNIQFRRGKPVLIDTLSLETLSTNLPWTPYRQFCEHFLAPLALMSYREMDLHRFLIIHQDGIPLRLADRLLPTRAYLNHRLLLHIKLHAGGQKHLSEIQLSATPTRRFSRNSLLGLVHSLEQGTNGLKPHHPKSNWQSYYRNLSYEESGFQNKINTVREYLRAIQPKIVWDLGANTGIFSKIACEMKAPSVIAWDMDHLCVEQTYQDLKKEGNKTILPLMIDLRNPTPAIGWHSQERFSFFQRKQAHTVLALALIHHLVIGNNLSLEQLALFFHEITERWLIIEFVPKEDIMARKLLHIREDIFSWYTKANFEKIFSRLFSIHRETSIKQSQRVLFLLEKL